MRSVRSVVAQGEKILFENMLGASQSITRLERAVRHLALERAVVNFYSLLLPVRISIRAIRQFSVLYSDNALEGKPKSVPVDQAGLGVLRRTLLSPLQSHHPAIT